MAAALVSRRARCVAMSRQSAKAAIAAVTLIVGSAPGRAYDLPVATVPVVAQPLILTSTLGNELIENEQYRDRKNRFIKAPDRKEIWFQDAKTQSKHLIRFKCDACGEPPPCHNFKLVRKEYISLLNTGEDFACRMLHESLVVNNRAILPVVTTTRTLPPRIAATTSTTSSAVAAVAGGGGSSSGGSSSGGWIFLLLLLLCCCLGGLGFGAYHFMHKKKKKPGKKNKLNKSKFAAEDQVPLVQDEGNEIAGQEQMTAMAPTYTAMAPQMGQAAMAAQAQMPTHTQMSGMQQASMPTQAAMVGQSMGQGMAGQASMPTQSWSPGAQAMQTKVLEQPPAMQQASMQTMVLEQPPGAMQPGQGSFAHSTQGSFYATGIYQQQQQPQQEMELVTITPNGYSVTPLAPGQGVPSGVPVFNQLPQN